MRGIGPTDPVLVHHLGIVCLFACLLSQRPYSILLVLVLLVVGTNTASGWYYLLPYLDFSEYQLYL